MSIPSQSLINGILHNPNTIIFSETSRNAATRTGSGPRKAGVIASVQVDKKNHNPKLRLSFHPNVLKELGWTPGTTFLDIRLAPPQTAGGKTTVLLSPLTNGKGRALTPAAKSASCARCVTVFVLPQHMIWHTDQGSAEIEMNTMEFQGAQCAFPLPF